MNIEGKRKIWKEYQKEIAEDRYFYVRSCVRQNFFPGAENMFVRIMKEFVGADVYEHPEHTTCTGIGYHCDIVPFETTMTVVARQFSIMNEVGYKNFVPSCVTSFGIYCEVLDTWKHFPETELKTRKYLKEATGRIFEIPENLVHSSDVIFKHRDKIASRAKYRLLNAKTGQPLKVVDHIGCHYAKMFPQHGVGGAEYPYVLAGLIESFGGEVIDYPERRHCCGFGFRQYFIPANRGYSVSNSKKKFESMKHFKPDLIVTNCPGCNLFLDRWQYAIKELEGTTYGENGNGIPVLTFEELTALMLGYDPYEEIGLQMHQTPCEPLFDKIGINYDIKKKYLISNLVKT